MPFITFIIAIVLLLTPLDAGADTINACAKQTNGTLRLVADLGQCKNNEAPISWESEGPQGPAGPQGPQGAPPRFELVGFSSETPATDDGVLAFNKACETEFSGSRWCSSREAFETSPLPSGLTGVAWVRPEFDASGVDVSGNSAAAVSARSCGNWTSVKSSTTGLTVVIESLPPGIGSTLSPYSGFLPVACDNILPVACCAPVP